jgi:hypothetical protein
VTSWSELEFSGIGSVPAQKSSLLTLAQQAVEWVSVTEPNLVILDGAVRDHRIQPGILNSSAIWRVAAQPGMKLRNRLSRRMTHFHDVVPRSVHTGVNLETVKAGAAIWLVDTSGGVNCETGWACSSLAGFVCPEARERRFACPRSPSYSPH